MTPVDELLTRHPHGITAIDTEYVRPRLDASHLILHGGRAAFVDTGTNSSVPNLLRALEALGVARDQVDLILVTHVHLDHAGGAGLLARALPQAKVVVHPRGLRHLADPGKLIAGSIAVYGEALFHQLYGEILPVPEARLLASDDGMRLSLAGRELQLIHTPGHALHHYCVVDPLARAVFTGDTFGLAYRETETPHGPFLFPTTTPVQFDPEALHQSIDRIASFEPESVYLTHYSRITGIPEKARALHRRLDGTVAVARACATGPDRAERMEQALFAYLLGELREQGFVGDETRAREALAVDVKLNVQGLVNWLDRLAAKAAG